MIDLIPPRVLAGAEVPMQERAVSAFAKPAARIGYADRNRDGGIIPTPWLAPTVVA